ncbi:MAG TPA: nuclear transport factor 2 family protein [Thermodesulfobacteriota bacterium]|nr:nuclear transport factor 2 family protein [Thermodesulfobacteriota bacterium]
MSEEAKIKSMVKEWSEAVRKKDLDKIMAIYADDVVSFDAVEKLRFTGKDEYGKHWKACFEFCPGGESMFEPGEMTVTADGSLAFAHSLLHCGGEGPDGNFNTCWMRVTQCFRKTDGEWKIAHEHYSVPFDMKTGQPLFNLEP